MRIWPCVFCLSRGKGNILDHIVTPSTNAISISNVQLGAQISDHAAVLCDISFKKPENLARSITYRKINEIDLDSFRNDLRASKICSEYNTMDLQTLVESYNSELGEILNKHAPIITKTTRLRSRGPWYDDNVHAARKHMRIAERNYRKYKSTENYRQFRDHEDMYIRALQSAKERFYSDLVDSNSCDQRKLFRTLNKVMHREKKNPLPDHACSYQLANDFNNYFHSKVDNIRTSFFSKQR